MDKTLGIRFGALCPKIKYQITEQGYTFDKDHIEHFQKDADALDRLRIRGLISHSEAEKATKKLVKKIAAHIQSFTT